MMRGLITILILFLFSLNSYACQCQTLAPLTKNTALQYDVIFLGKVIAVSPGEEESRARFTVISLYNGKSYTDINVDFDNATNCALNFVPGETWIIYGKWEEYGIPRAEMCGHSRVKPNAGQADYYAIEGRSGFDEEVKWLNDSLGVQAFIDPEQQKDLGHKNQLPDPTQAIVYTAVGLLGLGLIFYFVRRMFKRDGK